jgi:methionyl-tRNA formyltransferase
MQDLRIIFMGTPEFAVASLAILVENKFNLVAVITAPDRPQGRGQILTPSPVKEFALKNDIPVLQPINLKAPEFLEELKGYKANLQIVVAFRMLPELVWSMPAIGTFNLHASLLPQYRGAAPINWAIIRGEKETGVTTFFLKHDIDTGGILFQESEPILENDDVGSLYTRLMNKGAQLVLKTVKAIATNDYKPIPQIDIPDLKHAPKIFKETCMINWDQSSEALRNFVRGLSPQPTAWTIIGGKPFKIFKIKLVQLSQPGTAGEWKTDNKTFLQFKTANGWIGVEELQPEGKRRMNVEEFFRGNKLNPVA